MSQDQTGAYEQHSTPESADQRGSYEPVRNPQASAYGEQLQRMAERLVWVLPPLVLAIVAVAVWGLVA